MAVPAGKLDALTQELRDPAHLVSEFRLHELKRDIARLHDRGEVDDATYHQVLHGISRRLGDHDRALVHAREAVRLRPDVANLNNAGVALLEREPEVAARILVEAATLEGGHSAVVLSNLAEAFARMDAWDQARDTLDEALRVADVNDTGELFRLADAAGSVGRYAQSVNLFARTLALRHGVPAPEDGLAFLEACPDEWWIGLRVPESVETAIRRVRAVREGAPLVEAVDAGEDADASAKDVLEATRELRARANQVALPDA